MAKYFCTAGPVKPDIHYEIPPLDRIDRAEFFGLVDQQKYFILHAPRQTGKTSCLLAAVRELNATGKYRAIYANIEAAQAAREDQTSAMQAILLAIAQGASESLNDDFPDSKRVEVLSKSGGSGALREMLTLWSLEDSRPLCVMFDEVDALVGDSLISVLRQLRAGYPSRPERFPQSIVLCGIRDLRDYRIHGTKEIITGGSAFNIKAESMRLGDFSEANVRKLYELHTAETGQKFEEDLYPLVWDFTKGQPWLVNALAYEVCFRMKENRDRTRAITARMIQDAKANLILRRDTHLDQLGDKLMEPRVRRVVAPILEGSDRESGSEATDDTQYAIDLGLIRKTSEGLEIANSIYREIIPRELSYDVQTDIGAYHQTEWYVGPGGKLQVEKLIEAFQQFYRENAEIWLRRFMYQEAGPQLLLQAFLQRIVNGGGRIDREYGLGRRRTDLLIVWNHPEGVQRVVIEIKMLRKGLERTIQEGLKQTADYIDRVGAAEGHLVIFDGSTEEATWDSRIFRKQEGAITVWGM